MSILVPIAMFGWIPTVLALFAWLPARRAVIAAFLLAWMFLPMAVYKVPGITAYTKMTATCAGILLSTLLFDVGSLTALRIRWFDIPMIIWCMCPFASSATNGLGVYDGVSAVIYQSLTWGAPYVIGRAYCSDIMGLRELAIGIFIGGLIYVPFCLYEIRMSPQLHRLMYGFSVGTWSDVKRWGGWRPTVFMQHGLMVGMWMTTASLIGVWLWLNGILRQSGGISAFWWLGALLLTTVFCKSTGALALLVAGLVVLLIARNLRTAAPIWLLIAASPLYMATRALGIWDGRQLIAFSFTTVGDARADSLEFRLRNEDILAAKAMQRPTFGWGGWGRSRVYNEDGDDISVTDGLWIIAFGQNGVVGLASLTTVLLLPAVLLLTRYPIGGWARGPLAPVAALAVLVMLYMIDNLFNGMVNPVFALAAGAATGFCGQPTLQKLGVASSTRRSPQYQRSAVPTT